MAHTVRDTVHYGRKIIIEIIVAGICSLIPWQLNKQKVDQK